MAEFFYGCWPDFDFSAIAVSIWNCFGLWLSFCCHHWVISLTGIINSKAAFFGHVFWAARSWQTLADGGSLPPSTRQFYFPIHVSATPPDLLFLTRRWPMSVEDLAVGSCQRLRDFLPRVIVILTRRRPVFIFSSGNDRKFV